MGKLYFFCFKDCDLKWVIALFHWVYRARQQFHCLYTEGKSAVSSLPSISALAQGEKAQTSFQHHHQHKEKDLLGLTDTLSSAMDSVPQLEHSRVRSRSTSSGSVGPTGTHSSDPCSAGTSLQHDIWQRHRVPFQSTQSALPSSPSFGFQEPLCSSKCFCECSFLSICWCCKNINTTTKSSLMQIAAASLFHPVRARSISKTHHNSSKRNQLGGRRV